MKYSFSIPKFSLFQSEVENPDDIDIKSLREGIKKRYNFYNAEDSIRFPMFDYNTNRRNYETLKESFEEDFYNRRGISRTNNSLHIPSTNTLAIFFTDDSYKPSRKILNTLLAYSEDTEKINAKISNKTVRTSLSSNYSMVIKVLVILVLIISFSYKVFNENNIPLKILTPKTQTNAVRFLPIEGTAKYATENNIKQVWVVVRSKQSGNCYVQAPIQIKKNGDWKGYVIIGSEGNGDIGFTYEIRAYLNPLMKIKDGDILKSWPSAGVSTETVDVVRGENLVAEL